MTSASISTARSDAAESVVKNGLPVPAPKMTTRPFSKVTHRPTANERLCDLLQLNGALQTGVHTGRFQGALQGHGVDDRGKHAHVVALGALHASFLRLHSAENVASSDDNGTLNALVNNGLDFVCVLGQPPVVNAKLLVAHQGFTAQLQEDASVLHA